MDMTFKEKGLVVLKWVLGLLFVFAGFSYLSKHPIAGLSLLALASLTIPPVIKFIQEKVGHNFTRNQKIAATIILLIIWVVFSPSNSTTNLASEKEQQQNEEIQSSESSEVKQETAFNTEVKLYSVIKVIDGDTIDIDMDGKTERIRLIGINTAETVDPRKPVECFGVEASNKTKSVLSNQKVQIVPDPSQDTRDKYGRLLAYVYLDNGRNFNKLMIEEGFAYEYTYDKPYKYQTDFKQAQKDAENAKRGLWSDSACGNQVPTEAPKANITPFPKADTSPSTPPITGGDKDCDDFSTHAQAQAYFEAGGGSASYNFNLLDRDRDGIACETLP